jgi:hypothetical protein
VSNKAFKIVLNEISEASERIGRALIDGAAKDYAEYSSMTGQIRGLQLAYSYLKEMAQKIEMSDED